MPKKLLKNAGETPGSKRGAIDDDHASHTPTSTPLSYQRALRCGRMPMPQEGALVPSIMKSELLAAVAFLVKEELDSADVQKAAIQKQPDA